jgi:alanyl-tRNA synthetase
VNGVKLVIGQLPAAPAEQYRTQIDRVRQKAGSAFIVFLANDDGKVPVIVALTNDLIAKGLKAGEIIKPIAEIVAGKGGGKPDLAQAGGKDATKIDAALAKAKELAKSVLA